MLDWVEVSYCENVTENFAYAEVIHAILSCDKDVDTEG